MNDEAMDEAVNKRMNKRYVELAGMLKEKVKGSQEDLQKILAKFALQEGVRIKRATEYLEVLHHAGLVTYTYGDKRWKYNTEAEWELFRVEI